MLYLTATSQSRPAPYSTGHHTRNCRKCGAAFTGLGTLCPTHLAQEARQRAVQLQAERVQSEMIITAREIAAKAARGVRTEITDELDQMGGVQ
jgi:DTW domain-containing protein YfiP